MALGPVEDGGVSFCASWPREGTPARFASPPTRRGGVQNAPSVAATEILGVPLIRNVFRRRSCPRQILHHIAPLAAAMAATACRNRRGAPPRACLFSPTVCAFKAKFAPAPPRWRPPKDPPRRTAAAHDACGVDHVSVRGAPQRLAARRAAGGRARATGRHALTTVCQPPPHHRLATPPLCHRNGRGGRSPLPPLPAGETTAHALAVRRRWRSRVPAAAAAGHGSGGGRGGRGVGQPSRSGGRKWRLEGGRRSRPPPPVPAHDGGTPPAPSPLPLCLRRATTSPTVDAYIGQRRGPRRCGPAGGRVAATPGLGALLSPFPPLCTSATLAPSSSGARARLCGQLSVRRGLVARARHARPDAPRTGWRRRRRRRRRHAVAADPRQ